MGLHYMNRKGSGQPLLQTLKQMKRKPRGLPAAGEQTFAQSAVLPPSPILEGRCGWAADDNSRRVVMNKTLRDLIRENILLPS